MKRRDAIRALGSGMLATALAQRSNPADPPPNFVVILADDLGYGDLGCYGSRIRTPNLDQMAGDGIQFRQFCAASAVCSPSRAALLTGRYGVRSGVPYVLGPEQKVGMSLAETTLAQTLKAAGYRTMCVGKWHLGAFPQYLPTARGFDEYYGIPYSNDNSPSVLMRNTDVVEAPVTLETVTRRYTEQAVRFIRNAKDGPFFLYLPHTFPHIPLAASPDFAGKSPLGLYGDAVEELDWSVGQVLAELDTQGVAANTLVMFTSDNGPWFQGSPGPLRGRKGDTFEGGMREPFLARWPGRIAAGTVTDSFATMLDLYPTITKLARATPPRLPLDGADIWPLLSGAADSVDRPPFLYFDGFDVQCARVGRWKLHLSRANGPAFAPQPQGGRVNLPLLNPELYDMQADSEESYSVAAGNPSVVKDIRAKVEAMLPGFPPQVQNSWKDTLNRAVDPVNAGEWPSPKG